MKATNQKVLHSEDYKPQFYSPVTGDSMTVQEPPMTVREMLDRFASGQPITAGYHDPLYIEGLGDLEKIIRAEGGEYLLNLDRIRKAVQSARLRLDNIELTDTRTPAKSPGGPGGPEGSGGPGLLNDNASKL
jgi:hypothetical protein